VTPAPASPASTAPLRHTHTVPLDRYKKKRDFGKTPEPAGGASAAARSAKAPLKGGRFVVQRHRATRLHYDFRLEIGDVLVSWAVPKGPSLDPAVRRMAVHVEDHPIEYLDFEGVIPARQYGAGDVIVWDWGTWTPDPETPEPEAAVGDGELKFSLEGEKLRGRFTIVRTSRRPGAAPQAFEDDQGEQWLLIHKRDEASIAGWDPEDHPKSVKTGRTNDEVKARKDAIWVSQAPAETAEIDLAGARKTPMPSYIEPMRATLASHAFRDDDWLFEIKWDGYRVQAVVKDDKVRLFTRNGNDAETYFPRLLTPVSWIEAEQAIVDGEVVALDDDGVPDFSLLQERITAYRSAKPAALVFQAFDLLYLDGRSLVDVPLEQRKKLLRLVLRENRRVRFASHVETEGLAFFEAAKKQGVEGVVAKHRRSRYEPGRRATTWLKIKIRPEQELVVGGWTPGEGKASELGAVVVGVYEGDKLRFAGKVGSGFDARWRRELRRRLDELATEEPPFDPPPPTDYRGRWGGDLAGVRWIRPELVIRAELGGWTREGIVRQTSFKGLELDRDPGTVARERAVDPKDADRQAAKEVVPVAGGSNGGGRSNSAERSDSARSTKTRPSAADRPKPKGRAAKAKSSVSTEPAFAPATAKELAALDALGKEGAWEVGGETLKLTNLDKVLFPPPDGVDEEPITKRELIRYFAQIGPALLPHLADRALNLHRYPNGAGAPGFWQKDMPPHSPKWLTIWHETGFRERDDREANDHLVADRTATLCWLGNQAAFEIHAWTSTTDEPWKPTFALIDIDPGSKTTWEETLTLARLYRTALEHLSVRAYPKLTGSRGIQAWIPIVRGKYTYDDTSRWVGQLSKAIGSTVPDIVSWEWSKAERGGKARLDYTQNAAIKTLVAPYAVRPRPGAPVSAPITWDELDSKDLGPGRWTIRNEVERVAKVGDLFIGAQTDEQELPPL
jgi:bifunctional non-homologous end joining protein LigD